MTTTNALPSAAKPFAIVEANFADGTNSVCLGRWCQVRKELNSSI
jgi:hypothetical protein